MTMRTPTKAFGQHRRRCAVWQSLLRTSFVVFLVALNPPSAHSVSDFENATSKFASSQERKLASNIRGFCAPSLGNKKTTKILPNVRSKCHYNGRKTRLCTHNRRLGSARGNLQCKVAGRECQSSTSSRCCSRLCISCSGRCQGRCGLSQKAARDSIFAFYYPWYGSVAVDGQWIHWNADRRIGGGSYDPDKLDLASPYFPLLGPYSSSDAAVLNQHMKWMQMAGIGVAITSWWGPGSREDSLVWDVLDAADNYGIKVAFIVEPHSGGYHTEDGGTRTPTTAMNDTKHIIDTYGCHRAMHRINGRPVFFYFAAREYKHGNQGEWKVVWDHLHSLKRYNPFVITQDTDLQGRIIAGGWDGGFEYDCFAAIDAVPNLVQQAQAYEAAGKLYVMTACPGYDKSRIAPGTDPIISRRDGKLYQRLWNRITNARTKTTKVAITSFNEWHEGTAIEPATPLSISSYTYKNYERDWGRNGSAASTVYLTKTKQFGDKFLDAGL